MHWSHLNKSKTHFHLLPQGVTHPQPNELLCPPAAFHQSQVAAPSHDRSPARVEATLWHSFVGYEFRMSRLPLINYNPMSVLEVKPKAFTLGLAQIITYFTFLSDSAQVTDFPRVYVCVCSAGAIVFVYFVCNFILSLFECLFVKMYRVQLSWPIFFLSYF